MPMPCNRFDKAVTLPEVATKQTAQTNAHQKKNITVSDSDRYVHSIRLSSISKRLLHLNICILIKMRFVITYNLVFMARFNHGL